MSIALTCCICGSRMGDLETVSYLDGRPPGPQTYGAHENCWRAMLGVPGAKSHRPTYGNLGPGSRLPTIFKRKKKRG